MRWAASLSKAIDLAVVELEQRTDIYVSGLRSYIEAVGGRLRGALPSIAFESSPGSAPRAVS